MKLSARNQMQGTISSIERGAVNGIVTLDVNGMEIVGTISIGSIDSLSLEAGKKATAIVKATEVMIAIGELNISARNQITGTISNIEEGSVNGIVTITNGTVELSATISKASIQKLGLAVGKEATAVVKATSVMFGVE